LKISILNADLNKDRQAIIDILNQNRDYEVDSYRFEWLYLKNPFGPANIWLAMDKDVDKVIGAAAALPRMIWVKGKPTLCHVLSDFSVDQQYRSIGPALKLNRMSLTPVFDGDIPFAYDFPSDQMAVLHRWLKFEPIGEILRYVRPMRLESRIENFLGKGFLSKAISLFGNAALKMYPLRKIDRTYSVKYEKIESHSFDESFTELDRLVGPRCIVSGVRDQAYLTWHYALNPLRKFFLIKLVHDDTLCAYAIFTFKDRKRIQVYDIYSTDSVIVKHNLLLSLLRTAYLEKAEAIEMSLLNTNPWIPFLKKHGFFLRSPSFEIFVFSQKDSLLDNIVNLAGNWYMTLGDRDT